MRKWRNGVPIGGIRVLNRLNTDSPPGPPSVESIPVCKPTAAPTSSRDQLVNFEATKATSKDEANSEATKHETTAAPAAEKQRRQ